MGSENRGPLTTTFTAPSSCSTDLSKLYQVVTNGGEEYWAQGPINLGSCFPSGYGGKTSEYYSPGVCPSGYKPACTGTNVKEMATETVYTCCPTERAYTCADDNHQPGWGGCYYDLPSSVLTSVYHVEGGSTSLMKTVTSASGAIHAHSIQVKFQPTDFDLLVAGSADFRQTKFPSISGTSTTEISATSTAASSSRGNNTSSGLGTGALVGISIAAGVLGTLIVAAVVFLFNKRKTRMETSAKKLQNEKMAAYEQAGSITKDWHFGLKEISTHPRRLDYEVDASLEQLQGQTAEHNPLPTFRMEVDASSQRKYPAVLPSSWI